MVLKNSMWLHLNSHKNSIFTTILKFNPFTQVNKCITRKTKLDLTKAILLKSETMKNVFQIFYKWSSLGQFTTLGEQRC